MIRTVQKISGMEDVGHRMNDCKLFRFISLTVMAHRIEIHADGKDAEWVWAALKKASADACQD